MPRVSASRISRRMEFHSSRLRSMPQPVHRLRWRRLHLPRSRHHLTKPKGRPSAVSDRIPERVKELGNRPTLHAWRSCVTTASMIAARDVATAPLYAAEGSSYTVLRSRFVTQFCGFPALWNGALSVGAQRHWAWPDWDGKQGSDAPAPSAGRRARSRITPPSTPPPPAAPRTAHNRTAPPHPAPAQAPAPPPPCSTPSRPSPPAGPPAGLPARTD